MCLICRKKRLEGRTEIVLRECKKVRYIPSLPEGLDYFCCQRTNLTYLPALCNSLRVLRCYRTKITEIPILPPLLEVLYCQHNRELCSLPQYLPETLLELNCEDTGITVLPNLPPNLFHLDCQNTDITILPPLPDSLQNLYIDYSKITMLPKLPRELSCLSCEYTNISVLPNIPENTRRLYINNTKISELPLISPALECLHISHTRITRIPENLRLESFICWKSLAFEIPMLIPGLTHQYQVSSRFHPHKNPNFAANIAKLERIQNWTRKRLYEKKLNRRIKYKLLQNHLPNDIVMYIFKNELIYRNNF